jgi:hypothetical protein
LAEAALKMARDAPRGLPQAASATLASTNNLTIRTETDPWPARPHRAMP